MNRVRYVSDFERRARLAARHALAPDHRVDSPEAVTTALGVLHATEAATVYLSCWARMKGCRLEDIDRALYGDRQLIKQLAMRRTLFVFPRNLVAAAWGSASARVAGLERTRMVKEIVLAGIAENGDAWLDRARAQVIAALDGVPDGLTGAELRAAAPLIDVRVQVSRTGPWSGSRVLVHLGATGDIMRAANTGHWRTSRPRWTLTRNWLGEVPAALPAADGYRELVRRWLSAFGPGTEDDIVWWLGATKATVRTALAELGAVEVSLDGGANGYLLPEDLDEVGDPGSWVALLPVLDPTVMGWRDRDFYLGPHREHLFDRNGNAGTTAWIDGRIVGCWVQDDGGVVRVRLLEPVAARQRQALEAEAARLSEWLDGVRIQTVVPSPAMRAE